MINLIVRPLFERGGFHTDRFEAVLNGHVLYRGPRPYLGGAKALLERGYDPAETLLLLHEEKGPPIFTPHSIQAFVDLFSD